MNETLVRIYPFKNIGIVLDKFDDRDHPHVLKLVHFNEYNETSYIGPIYRVLYNGIICYLIWMKSKIFFRGSDIKFDDFERDHFVFVEACKPDHFLYFEIEHIVFE